ncbi:MAG: hypothetical protein ACE5KM_22165 [Planctomycetaceae bacterium]
MRTVKNLVLSLSLLGIVSAGMFVGCSKKKTGDAGKTGDTNAALKELPKDQQEALSKLSADDLKLALQQKTCPVRDKPLGSMGKPIKVTVKDQDVFVCCDGCVDSVKNEPDKYLAKLKKK